MLSILCFQVIWPTSCRSLSKARRLSPWMCSPGTPSRMSRDRFKKGKVSLVSLFPHAFSELPMNFHQGLVLIHTFLHRYPCRRAEADLRWPSAGRWTNPFRLWCTERIDPSPYSEIVGRCKEAQEEELLYSQEDQAQEEEGQACSLEILQGNYCN